MQCAAASSLQLISLLQRFQNQPDIIVELIDWLTDWLFIHSNIEIEKNV